MKSILDRLYVGALSRIFSSDHNAIEELIHLDLKGGNWHERAGGDDSGDRVRRGEVGGGRRAVPDGAAAGDSCRAVQAAEHVEQRRGLRGRGRDRARAGGTGARGPRRAADGLQPGAGEAADRPRLSGRGARAAGGDAAGVRLPGGAGPIDERGHGELRAVGGRVRSGDRGRRRKPGGGQSARYEAAVDAALDAVADTLSSAVDLDALFGAAGRPNVATGPTA